MPSEKTSVYSFYTNKGWKTDNCGSTLDAELFEDLRHYSQHYLSLNRRKLRKYFPSHGHLILDCASGPIQYSEYLDYSLGYDKRVCVDLSSVALSTAKAHDPSKIIVFEGDIRTLDLSSYSFDTILSLHTIYHLPLQDQINVIAKFISLLNPKDGHLLIVYSNPQFLLERIKRVLKFIGGKSQSTLFTFERYTPEEIRQKYPQAELIPYRVFSGEDMKRLFPNFFTTRILLNVLYRIEHYLPISLCQYYIIKLTSS